jgi:hypothetical protein
LKAATADDNNSSGGDGNPLPHDPELAATLQTLTAAAGDPKQNVLLLQLAYYDAGTAALEAHFNTKRDEKCFELWNGRENLGQDVDSYEYECWCGARDAYSAIHCTAYSNVHGNATLHKMQEENSKNPEYGYPAAADGTASAARRGGNSGGGGGGIAMPIGGARRLAETLEALQLQAARAPRSASPVDRRGLTAYGKGALSGAATEDGSALSTAVAPYYGGAPLASPSSALVGAHGRRLSQWWRCGFAEGKVTIGLLIKFLLDTLIHTINWCAMQRCGCVVLCVCRAVLCAIHMER